MAWTTPKTWTSEVLSSANLNTHLRDNLNYLFAPSTADFTTTANYSTTSTTFVDVNSTDFSLTIAPAGTEVWIFFRGSINSNTGTNASAMDLTKDGSSLSSETSGVVQFTSTTAIQVVSFVFRVTGLTPTTSYNFKLQWLTAANTLVLQGANTDNYFAVREMT